MGLDADPAWCPWFLHRRGKGLEGVLRDLVPGCDQGEPVDSLDIAHSVWFVLVQLLFQRQLSDWAYPDHSPVKLRSWIRGDE